MANDKRDDRKPETPEDVAALYAWANMQNVKYRDFSANRREHRVQQQMQRPIVTRSEVAPTAKPPAPAAKPVPRRVPNFPGRLGDPYSVPEHKSLEDSKRPAAFFELPPLKPVASWDDASTRVNLNAVADRPARDESGNVLRPTNRNTAAPQRSADAANAMSETAARPVETPPAAREIEHFETEAPAYPQAAKQTQRPQVAEPAPIAVEAPVSWRYSDVAPEDSLAADEPVFEQDNEFNHDEDRPAWLNQEAPVRYAQRQAQPQAAAPDTLIDTRERVASRWFALRGVFDAAPDQSVRQQEFRAPVAAVFSLAGGVGKTSIVATLGRALSGTGERVLLADTTSYGLMPFYYGARELRPGVVRTFTPPPSTGDSPVNMVSYDAETHGVENEQDSLLTHISEAGRGSNRILVDLATASAAVAKRILRMAPTVIVPIVPDMSSVIGLTAVEQFFRNHRDAEGKLVQPYYLLNQFDPAQPLHLDVREVLRQRLGDRLLPIVLRRSQAVSEALAEGMTVMDYAPKSGIADDYASLGNWLRNLQAPAQQSFRAMRWSEQ